MYIPPKNALTKLNSLHHIKLPSKTLQSPNDGQMNKNLGVVVGDLDKQRWNCPSLSRAMFLPWSTGSILRYGPATALERKESRGSASPPPPGQLGRPVCISKNAISITPGCTCRNDLTTRRGGLPLQMVSSLSVDSDIYIYSQCRSGRQGVTYPEVIFIVDTNLDYISGKDI